ncbi:uncharacterized protein LOC100371859 [Saccoglossus kowalevskii]|uniref:Actin-related protein 4-like n=1 Tax=Saccoglossus kowalevskii TaxID=10224 RepID=A0ABM0GM08_SACKO|nr:PREDICTED: actin-related protein 4-like [Saccoglossus kowalevskii]
MADQEALDGRPTFLDLPVEISEYILSFCDIETLSTICKSSKRLRDLADSEIVWKVKWQQVKSEFGLNFDVNVQSHRYKDLCRRAILCLAPPKHENNTFYCDCNSKQVDDIIAYDIGAGTSWICWVGRFDKRGCPTKVAHLRKRGTEINELNVYLTSIGHPRVSHSYVVGKDAKILSAMYPHLYKSDFFPVYCEESFRRDCKSHSLPDVLKSRASTGNANPDPDSDGDSIRRKSMNGFLDSETNTTSDYDYSACTCNGASSMDSSGKQTTLPTNSALSHEAESNTFELHHPIINGNINRVANIELIIRHLFRQLTFGTHHYYHLHNTPIVVLEPPNLSEEARSELLQMMFEKLKIPRLCLQNKALSLSTCLGLDMYLVIDSGSHCTAVTPIIDCKVQRHAVQFKPIGGYDVSYLLADFITDSGRIDKVLVDSLDSRCVKEVCYIAYDPVRERKKCHSPRTIIVQKPGSLKALKEAHKVDLGTERFLACEDMYLRLDLPSMINSAIQACHPSTHKLLLSRLILTGGNTQLTGFANRIYKDLREIVPNYADSIYFVQPNSNALSRALNAWTVHYKAAPLATCKWTSREDYILHGVDAINCKDRGLCDKTADPCQYQS